MEPYTFTGIAVAAFAVLVANDKVGKTFNIAYLSSFSGAILVGASVHLALLASERAMDAMGHGAWCFDVAMHTALVVGFALATTYGVPTLVLGIADSALTSDPGEA